VEVEDHPSGLVTITTVCDRYMCVQAPAHGWMNGAAQSVATINPMRAVAGLLLLGAAAFSCGQTSSIDHWCCFRSFSFQSARQLLLAMPRVEDQPIFHVTCRPCAARWSFFSQVQDDAHHQWHSRQGEPVCAVIRTSPPLYPRLFSGFSSGRPLPCPQSHIVRRRHRRRRRRRLCCWRYALSSLGWGAVPSSRSANAMDWVLSVARACGSDRVCLTTTMYHQCEWCD
jgi:hypothetical protein